MESPILIDVWTFDPSRRDELSRGISEAMRDVIVPSPGFVSGELLESSDGGALVVVVRMRTVEERQALTDSREARKVVRELRAIARSHARVYRLIESFGEA